MDKFGASDQGARDEINRYVVGATRQEVREFLGSCELHVQLGQVTGTYETTAPRLGLAVVIGSAVSVSLTMLAWVLLGNIYRDVYYDPASSEAVLVAHLKIAVSGLLGFIGFIVGGVLGGCLYPRKETTSVPVNLTGEVHFNLIEQKDAPE